MRGGAGADSYWVNSKGDVVIEGSSTVPFEADIIFSTITLTLGANVENLALTGAANLDGTGNGLANFLLGNRGDNVLMGLAGDDGLDGGLGNDTLVGGAGADIFAFRTTPDTAGNRDTISDFDPTADKIYLALTSFALPGAQFSALGAAAFWASATGAAHDGDDRILYNTVTGVLSYDSNGNLAGGVTQFAVLTGHPSGVTAGDFFLL